MISPLSQGNLYEKLAKGPGVARAKKIKNNHFFAYNPP